MLSDDSENKYDNDVTIITYTNYTVSLVHLANANDSLSHEMDFIVKAMEIAPCLICVAQALTCSAVVTEAISRYYAFEAGETKDFDWKLINLIDKALEDLFFFKEPKNDEGLNVTYINLDVCERSIMLHGGLTILALTLKHNTTKLKDEIKAPWYKNRIVRIKAGLLQNFDVL
ncbi:unnamed protein product [Didymodactylos carnosus]|uniref:Uncharacterized protein n=2 Tax=Didymodactylos carnosus TaxID=1234261 RepID=A0A815E4Q0_9BILA|nr:unnamed protein product [Didymodactylos carnosus]CAF4146685.1 unnamed protein product [Didymodactylos carnosus]